MSEGEKENRKEEREVNKETGGEEEKEREAGEEGESREQRERERETLSFSWPKRLKKENLMFGEEVEADPPVEVLDILFIALSFVFSAYESPSFYRFLADL